MATNTQKSNYIDTIDDQNRMDKKKSEKPRWRKWLSRGFVIWGAFALTYLFLSYRTVDVDPHLLQSDGAVAVNSTAEQLELSPAEYETALVFFCGSGVSAESYAPLLHPLAEEGYGVFIVKLPYRFAPWESHRVEAIQRATRIIASHPEVAHWVVAGHSLGGVLACRFGLAQGNDIAGMVLLGTTHPRDDDLSQVNYPITKVYASNDGIAPVEKVNSNKRKLPDTARFVLVEGGNHSQFANYAGQFLDGTPTIPRAEQQAIARDEISKMLKKAGADRD